MSECWKCHQKLPDGQTECNACLEGNHFIPSEVDSEADDKDLRENWMEVDWDRIKSLDQLKMVLNAAMVCPYVYKQTPHFNKVKRFLKPIDDENDAR